MKSNKQRGSLLLEVLIAATVLSIGILSCLNIFSSAIHATSRVYEASVAWSYMDQALFQYFLDPTSVNLEPGERTLPHDGKSNLRPRLKVESLKTPETVSNKEKDSKTQKPPAANASNAATEFYKTNFIAERNGGKIKYEFKQILFSYGKKKKTESDQSK